MGASGSIWRHLQGIWKASGKGIWVFVYELLNQFNILSISHAHYGIAIATGINIDIDIDIAINMDMDI